MSHQQTILVIDDSSDILHLVKARLTSLDVRIDFCDNGEDGFQFARRQAPDLILLDVSMPGIGGFEVCRRLKQDPATQDIPVIFLTGSDDPQAKVRGFEVGAVDYVTKPFNPSELRARVRSALRTQLLIDMLEAQARTDSLTGLANRKGFIEKLELCLERMKQRDCSFAVLFMDLDQFKAVNDSLGHEIGDALLVRVARTLTESVRTERVTNDENSSADTIARMGGDEFVVLLAELDSVEVARRIARRVSDGLARPLNIEGHEVSIGVSIGIRFGGSYEGRCDDLLRDADEAMYEAKAAGRGRIVVFQDAAPFASRARMTPPNAQPAVAEPTTFCDDDLCLTYHPIVDLMTGRVAAFETVLKIVDSKALPTDREAVRVGEDDDDHRPRTLTEWLLGHACEDLAAWQRHVPDQQMLKLHVNLPRHHWFNCDVPMIMHRVLRDTPINPANLVLELTESQFFCDPTTIWPMIQQVRAMGVGLALDHFGKDTTSLISLHRFPLDLVKIDRSFVRCIPYSRPFAAMVAAIVTLGWNLNLSVVAEGVDTLEQAAELQALDCTLGQGGLFGEAMSASAVPGFLTRATPIEPLAGLDLIDVR